MGRIASPRRHRLGLHRPRPRRALHPGGGEPIRLSDLILAILGVTFLAALSLVALADLIGRALVP